MSRINILKYGIFLSALLLLYFIILLPIPANTATFNVTNEDELREALSTAESNGEDDIINLTSEIYRTNGSPFVYITIEDFSLSIIGQGPEFTRLIPTNEPSRILVIETPNTEIKSKGNITIEGILIEGGYSQNEYGGGLFVGGFGIVTIKDCEFRSNSAFYGGALTVTRTDNIYLNGNNFIGNSAQAAGGGAQMMATDVNVENNIFEKNSAIGIEGGGGSSGGGLTVYGINVVIKNNLFNGNLALMDGNGGGAVIGGEYSLILTNNVFINNFAGSFGGGADIYTKTAIISENEFNDNSSGSVGGGFSVRSDELIASKNTITNNSTLDPTTSTGGGGVAIFIPDGYPSKNNNYSITNNILVGNATGGNGGGLYIDLDTDLAVLGEIVTITNNTLAFNTTNKDGGGIDIYNPSTHENDIGIYNNIAYSNIANSNGNDISITDGVFSNIGLNLNLFNNDFAEFYSNCEIKPGCQSNINRVNNIDEDPLFVDAETGDVSLQPESPCIDSGDPNAPDVPDTDIFGNPRIPPPDMGAVEYITEAANNGGCSIAPPGANDSLPLCHFIPALIVIRRIFKKCRN